MHTKVKEGLCKTHILMHDKKKKIEAVQQESVECEPSGEKFHFSGCLTFQEGTKISGSDNTKQDRKG